MRVHPVKVLADSILQTIDCCDVHYQLSAHLQPGWGTFPQSFGRKGSWAWSVAPRDADFRLEPGGSAEDQRFFPHRGQRLLECVHPPFWGFVFPRFQELVGKICELCGWLSVCSDACRYTVQKWLPLKHVAWWKKACATTRNRSYQILAQQELQFQVLRDLLGPTSVTSSKLRFL